LTGIVKIVILVSEAEMTTLFLLISFLVGMQVGKFKAHQDMQRIYKEWKDVEDGRS
jgi:hypothetical protein